MKTLRDLSDAQLQSALKHDGLALRVGPYVYSIRSSLPIIHAGLKTLYGDFELALPKGFVDYSVAIDSSNIIHRFRNRIDFHLDRQRPFNRIERRHAWAFLEWGMNWCVSVCANEYLKLHSAVVSKDGVALIMPGLPGAGKSTLCAALALSGWRVLSDEHALIPLGSSDVVPLYRPVSLKNESIEVIRNFSDRVEFGPETHETHKGVVAHLKADFDPDSHDCNALPARLMIFPQFSAGAPLTIRDRKRAESFMFAGHHSFNYSVLSEAGFDTMSTLLDAVRCYDLSYGDLDQALTAINDLHAQVCTQ
jgi:HprK-related kinase A